MSSAKWCPEIVLRNSSNEKEGDRRVKTWEEKAEDGKVLKERVVFRKED